MKSGSHSRQPGGSAKHVASRMASGQACFLRRCSYSLKHHRRQRIGNKSVDGVERSGLGSGSVSILLFTTSTLTVSPVVAGVFATISCGGSSGSSLLPHASGTRATRPVAVVLDVGVKEGAHPPVVGLFSKLPPHLDAEVDRRRQQPHLDDEVVLPQVGQVRLVRLVY